LGAWARLAGAFVAAMVLGMMQALGAVYLPDAAALLPFALMVAILIWKPAGFAGSGLEPEGTQKTHDPPQRISITTAVALALGVARWRMGCQLQQPCCHC
jgi:hypothetical protein